MNWTLEVVCVPVSDVQRAKIFYAEQLGFHVDFDSVHGRARVVQLTPPGLGCSIAVGSDMWQWQSGSPRRVVDMEPGSLQGAQFVVADVKAAHAELVERGADVSEIQVYDAAGGGLRPAREGEELDNVGFGFVSDPDGNSWAVQQISARARTAS